MNADAAAIVDLMHAFASGRVEADDFVTRYSDLWRQLRDEQYAAIDRTPGMAARLSELREQWKGGELTDRQFGAAIEREHRRVDGVSPRPGDATDEALGHIFVECGAYASAAGEVSGDPADREGELREEVQRALDVMERAT